MQYAMNDHAYMAEALRHARKGLYTTRANPRVGCVIVKQNTIIGTGYHAYQGQSHAEVVALKNASASVEKATAYVTLEPCSHQGNTLPCVEALVDAKVSRVVAAMQDPNPQVDGKGFSYLGKHGIETLSGILELEARELNKGFIKRVTQNRPYITVKSAISLDGKTALSSGESKWITSESARKDVHKLRARSCAILTGIETVLMDDPALTVRLSKDDLGLSDHFEQPSRVILDTHLRVSANAKILNQSGKVIIYTCSSNKEKIAALKNEAIEIVITRLDDKRIDLNEVLLDLAKREVNEILVEAGPTVVGSLVEQQLFDEMILYIAPHLLGDASRGLVQLQSIMSMQDRIDLQRIETNIVGDEIKVKLKPVER